MLSEKNILFLLVVFLSNIVQSITGFAGTVLAMPFSLMLVGYATAKPVLNALGIVISLGVVATGLKHLNKKEFLKISGVMLVGIFVGYLIIKRYSFNPQIMYRVLGIVVIIFALMGAVKFVIEKRGHKSDFGKGRTKIFLYIILVAAGLVHGMFVCGGPLLVVYASKALKNKEEFRVTVSAVWILLNSVILVGDIRQGYFTAEVTVLLLISVVIIAAVLFLGNLIFKKMNKSVFTVITYVLMGISGISLLFK